MKVEDLMVRDWVYITEHPMKKEAKQVKPEHFLRSLVIFEPIPLTLEILEKNGFEKHISDTRMFFHHDEYRLSYYLVNKHFTIYNQIDGSLVQRDIVNVHELQHALKLCGINKEIVV